MKKYVIALFFAIILVLVLIVGFSHAKYTSANTLSFNVTFEEDDSDVTRNEVTLVTGSELNAMIKKLVNPSCTHLELFFGTYDEYYESVVGAWENCSEEYYAAVDAQGKRSGAIRVFEIWGGYRIYVLAESGFEIAMNPDSSNMFSGLSYLAYINGLAQVDTSLVKNMRAMFKDCSVLFNPELSNFNTEKVTDMGEMFSGCQWNITELDLSSFVTTSVKKMDSMFAQCTNLRTIQVSEGWDTGACEANDDMFVGCDNLFGGQGTSCGENYHYNVPDYASITYARVDGGKSAPGYLTYKANAKVSAASLDEEEGSTSKVNKKPQTSTTTTETVTEKTVTEENVTEETVIEETVTEETVIEETEAEDTETEEPETEDTETEEPETEVTETEDTETVETTETEELPN